MVVRDDDEATEDLLWTASYSTNDMNAMFGEILDRDDLL